MTKQPPNKNLFEIDSLSKRDTYPPLSPIRINNMPIKENNIKELLML